MNTSPIFKRRPEPVFKKVTLTFPQAIEKIMAGKKLSRKGWEDKEEYAYVKNEWLTIHTKGADHTWQVHETDMVADDWFIV